MKKTFLMLLAGIVLAGFTFTACDDDDDKSTPEVTNPDEGGNTGTPEVLPESLQGSDYYVLVMDDTTIEKISDKVTLDLRYGWEDEDGFHGDELWIWDGTYEAGVSSGLNFYGEIADWCSLVVAAGTTWSGLGYCLYLDEEQYAKMAIDNTYYLHLAYKTSQTGISHAVYVVDPTGANTSGFAIGDGGDFVDNETTYYLIQPDSGTFETGEWNEYNIPISSLGLDWNQTYVAEQNILCVLSGGVQGTTLDLDAVFFYKKAE